MRKESLEERYCIYNADCLEVLRTLGSETVDCLITDPPAGIGLLGIDWDKDKGGKEQWIQWMTQVMEECLRVCKEGSYGIVWAFPRTSHWTAEALDRAGWTIIDKVMHISNQGVPKNNNCFKNSVNEYILVRKPKRGKVKPANMQENRFGDDTVVVSSRKGTSDFGLRRKYKGIKNTVERVYEKKRGRYPTNVVLDEGVDPEIEKYFFCSKRRKKDELVEGVYHPAQKPLALMNYFVRIFSNKGEIILDPFNGVGSTGVSALENKRGYIGIEMDEKYFDASIIRFNSVLEKEERELF